jgi:hypothetical protein
MKILHESKLDEATEASVRKQASKELDLDLSKALFKALVRQIVEVFLQQMQ